MTAPSLRRNTTYNALSSLTALAVGFVLAPLLLRHLGLDRFGYWSLLWAITGSLALVDLRIAAAVTRFAADAWARGELERFSRLVSTGLAFYLALGLLEVGRARARAREIAMRPLQRFADLVGGPAPLHRPPGEPPAVRACSGEAPP